MRRLTAAVLAIGVMGTLAGTAAPVAAQPTHGVRSIAPVHSQDQTAKRSAAGKYSHAAHLATNKQRTSRDLKALRRTRCVQRFAVRQAKAMARQESMYHQDLGPILETCKLSGVGENVAYGYPTGRSVVVDGWMNSAGHRDNILNPTWRLMGIGARKGHNGRWYVAQVFGRKG